uniref:Uncharacterized protein n=1 Tax=Picea glauca TaxID=3330 RepID=A0A101LZA4_PICGL|nr:hypothetical protein ABT39_MTgene5080 [Picea glauca]QHR87708.1 hypothetical protein Q903MT_gene1720 [Picea sitchensis]
MPVLMMLLDMLLNAVDTKSQYQELMHSMPTSQ